MKGKVLNLLVWVLIGLLGFVSPGCANDELIEFTFGTVVKISKEVVTIVEYDIDTGDDIEIEYTVMPETEYINIDMLSNLRIGDEIELEYFSDGGKRLATLIEKDNVNVDYSEEDLL